MAPVIIKPRGSPVRHRPVGSWSRGWLFNVLSLGRFGLRQILRHANGFSSRCGRSSDTRRLVQRRLAPSTTPPQTSFSPSTEGCVALFHGPKDGGRSRHGAPAFKTHRIASMRRCSFAHLRPRRCKSLRLLRWPLIFSGRPSASHSGRTLIVRSQLYVNYHRK